MRTQIKNSNFSGVKWDGQALEAVNIVAKGLLNLTELFKSQNINIECLLKIVDPNINAKQINNKKKKISNKG